MSKGLEALKNINRERPTFFSTLYDSDMWKQDIATIEKELKELEDIEEKSKAFDLLLYNIGDSIAVSYTVNHEGKTCFALTEKARFPITQEAFDLLKKYLNVL